MLYFILGNETLPKLLGNFYLIPRANIRRIMCYVFMRKKFRYKKN